MFSDAEWVQIEPLLHLMTRHVQTCRERTGASVEAAVERGYEWPVLAKHKELTGLDASDVGCIERHRLSDHGPPCRECGRLLRMKNSKKCYDCGNLVA